MSNSLMPHPDRTTLLRLLDDDLAVTDRQVVDGHLGNCILCQNELDDVREAIDDHLRFHRAVLKVALPPAPKSWDRLDVLAAKAHGQGARSIPRLFPFASARWLAAAAAIVAVFVFVRLTQRAPEVKAAELLQKAKSAEELAPARKRSIRIKSRKYAWDRPARIAEGSEAASADASGIRQLLESAGYDWHDPLSATAYVGWHDRLPVKQDRVEGSPLGRVIHTTTTASPISDASLTLAADLRVVACTLRFGESESVELSELPDGEPARHADARRGPPTPVQSEPALPPSQPAGPSEELEVIAALHRIEADLGEPVDVTREGGTVFVNVTGIDPVRQAELKTALAGLPAVRLQFGVAPRAESPASTRRSVPQIDTANPILAELQAALPQAGTTADLADQLSQSTEKILDRAYALRGLARRFPHETTAQLAMPEVDVLRGIVLDHVAAIEAYAAKIEHLMRPILPHLNPAGGVSGNTWQDAAQAMLDGARELDQAANVSGDGDSATRKSRVARALADVGQRSMRLRALVQP